jgi:hypothetical protein
MAESLRIFERLFQTAANLDDLHIGFGYTKICHVFFKAMIQSLKTRKAHVKTRLRSLKTTLEALRLKNIWFYGQGDDEPIAGFLQNELELKEVTFHYLNLDSRGMSFIRVHKLRPKPRMYDVHSELDDEGWAFVETGTGSEGHIILRSADSDDVKYLLGVIDSQWVPAGEWDWEGYQREIREVI